MPFFKCNLQCGITKELCNVELYFDSEVIFRNLRLIHNWFIKPKDNNIKTKE